MWFGRMFTLIRLDEKNRAATSTKLIKQTRERKNSSLYASGTLFIRFVLTKPKFWWNLQIKFLTWTSWKYLWTVKSAIDFSVRLAFISTIHTHRTHYACYHTQFKIWNGQKTTHIFFRIILQIVRKTFQWNFWTTFITSIQSILLFSSSLLPVVIVRLLFVALLFRRRETQNSRLDSLNCYRYQSARNSFVY